MNSQKFCVGDSKRAAMVAVIRSLSGKMGRSGLTMRRHPPHRSHRHSPRRPRKRSHPRFRSSRNLRCLYCRTRPTSTAPTRSGCWFPYVCAVMVDNIVARSDSVVQI